ncbi:MAG: STAS domain-containing protein [Stackebrandtia sp.]
MCVEDPPRRHAVRFTLDPAIARGDIADACENLASMVGQARPDVVICDVGEVAEPTLVVVEALARLKLTARRLGVRLLLEHVSDRLRMLLTLTGLTEALSD